MPSCICVSPRSPIIARRRRTCLCAAGRPRSSRANRSPRMRHRIPVGPVGREIAPLVRVSVDAISEARWHVVVSHRLHDPPARHPARVARDRRADRRRRDGGGLPRAGHEARPGRGPQGSARRDGVEPGAAGAVPAGGPGRRRAQSPAHRDDPLGRGMRRCPLPHHGARRGPVARPSHGRERVASRQARRDRHRARGRPGRGAREGHHSQGPEARQRDGGQRRAGQDSRLRSRQGRARRGVRRPTAPSCRPR